MVGWFPVDVNSVECGMSIASEYTRMSNIAERVMSIVQYSKQYSVVNKIRGSDVRNRWLVKAMRKPFLFTYTRFPHLQFSAAEVECGWGHGVSGCTMTA